MAKWTILELCDACWCARCAFSLQPDGTVRRLCHESDLQEMVTSYAETALWSSTEYSEQGEMGDSLEENYGIDDIESDTFAEMVSDCDSFWESHTELLSDVTPHDAGHNFWLSRNGHGAGFFDCGCKHADELQRATKPYGCVDLQAYEGKVHS